jgi:hypothetical protein
VRVHICICSLLTQKWASLNASSYYCSSRLICHDISTFFLSFSIHIFILFSLSLLSISFTSQTEQFHLKESEGTKQKNSWNYHREWMIITFPCLNDSLKCSSCFNGFFNFLLLRRLFFSDSNYNCREGFFRLCALHVMRVCEIFHIAWVFMIYWHTHIHIWAKNRF